MDHYHTWFDLKSGVKDTDFARDLARYMAYLTDRKLIEGWTLTRRKLGLGPAEPDPGAAAGSGLHPHLPAAVVSPE